MNDKKLIAVTIALTLYAFTDPNVMARGGSGGFLVGQVQLRLARAGYYRGSIDRMSGNLTGRAIREYERAHGLQEGGKIGRQLLTTMGVEYEASNNRQSRHSFRPGLL